MHRISLATAPSWWKHAKRIEPPKSAESTPARISKNSVIRAPKTDRSWKTDFQIRSRWSAISFYGRQRDRTQRYSWHWQEYECHECNGWHRAAVLLHDPIAVLCDEVERLLPLSISVSLSKSKPMCMMRTSAMIFCIRFSRLFSCRLIDWNCVSVCASILWAISVAW